MSIETSLTAYFTLDETHGDSIGGAALAPVGGAAFAAGKLGSGAACLRSPARYLSRSSDVVLVTGNTDWSAAGWFRRDDDAESWLMGKYGSGAGKEWLLRAQSGGIVNLIVHNGAQAMQVSYSQTVAVGALFLAVAVHDVAQARIGLSVNGGPFEYGDCVGGNAGSEPFQVGNAGQSDGLAGVADEVGFWRRVLGDADVAYLWNDGAGQRPPVGSPPPQPPPLPPDTVSIQAALQPSPGGSLVNRVSQLLAIMYDVDNGKRQTPWMKNTDPLYPVELIFPTNGGSGPLPAGSQLNFVGWYRNDDAGIAETDTRFIHENQASYVTGTSEHNNAPNITVYPGHAVKVEWAIGSPETFGCRRVPHKCEPGV